MVNKTVVLGFSIAWAVICVVRLQAELVDVSLFNNIVYVQTSPNAPATPSSFYFALSGDTLNAGDFSDVNVTYTAPGGSAATEVGDLPINGTNFSSSSPFFSSSSDLQNALPFGTYAYTATDDTGANATITEPLSYNQDFFTTQVPALTPATYLGLQGFDPTTDFTLNFNSFAMDPNVSAAYVSVSITDLTTSTVVFSQDMLDADVSSVMIPANTLMAGDQYSYDIDFSNQLNLFDFTNNVNLIQGNDVQTEGAFTVASVASSGVAPNGTPIVPPMALMPEPNTIGLLLFALVSLARLRLKAATL